MPIPSLQPLRGQQFHQLPLGRWPATLPEVESSFVTGQGAKRIAVWADCLQLISAVHAAVGHLPAIWLGGSLLSNKPEPGDADIVFLVEWRDLTAAKVDPQVANFLSLVAANEVEAQFGLSVDSFIMEMLLFPGPTPSQADWEALRWRGYWDLLWSRSRDSDRAKDALPRRGYLEVIIDGFER